MNVKIDINDLQYVLEKTPADQNIMLTGRHGIGKSEILTEYFNKKGMEVIALFLGQMSDPGDLIGLPDKSEEKTIFRPPYWFPLDGKPIVLFLDELNRARPEVLQTIMDLALNRRLAGRDLPKGSRVIAAVNEGEEYQLTDLDPALVSRFNVFRFEPSVQEWLLWAKEKEVDNRVIRFITENQAWLDGDPGIGENEDTGLDKTPDRRGWKRVSDILKNTPRINKQDQKLISSIVGVRATNLFITKIAAMKAVTGEDLLLDFENIDFKQLKVHDYALLNEDIFQYLEIHGREENNVQTFIKNINCYMTFLKEFNLGEVMANFCSHVSGQKYPKAVNFIMRNCMNILSDINKYVRGLGK